MDENFLGGFTRCIMVYIKSKFSKQEVFPSIDVMFTFKNSGDDMYFVRYGYVSLTP